MSVATSILVQARTKGGPTAGPVGSGRVRTDADLPPIASGLLPPVEASTLEPQVLDEASVSLNATLPRNVAVLTVTPNEDLDDRSFSLQGMCSIEGVNGFGPTQALPQPDVVLADLAQGVNPEESAQPSQILGIMWAFSQENGEVPRWVNELRAATGDDLHLVIQDYTGFEIPWELLTLPASESGDETYLGAAVSTTRWQYIIDTSFEKRPPQYSHEQLAGHIAAFVDVQELKGGGKEIAVLTDLHVTVESGLKELTKLLMSAEAGFGLVYLAWHGHSAPTPAEYALGSPATTGYRLVLSALQGKKLNLFNRSKVIVFINACHSGRMRRDNKYLRTKYLRGFPEVFLSKGAVGVIGTTGFVNDEFAAKMAGWFLSKLSTTEEPVSRLLRRWRAEVLRNLLAEPTEEHEVELLNACMYVYYGNPQSQLRITEGPP